MKFRMDQAQQLYSQPNPTAVTGTQIAMGEEVEIGGEVKRNGVGFCPVRRSNGQAGYIPGDTRASHIKPMTIDQADVAIYTGPSAQSYLRGRLGRNSRIWMFPGVVQDGAQQFVRIRDNSGNEGYMDGSTRVKGVVEVTRKAALKNLTAGALWCVGGLIVTIATYAAASDGGGTYFIMWGPVIFGAIQFFKGLGQLMSAPI
ncbi:MAG TPA: hypothetical protein VML19_25260 [Verrucomicrobiae bacterium]|nr:hypothetical protein [Verrucomicrobiae bacterium]